MSSVLAGLAESARNRVLPAPIQRVLSQLPKSASEASCCRSCWPTLSDKEGSQRLRDAVHARAAVSKQQRQGLIVATVALAPGDLPLRVWIGRKKRIEAFRPAPRAPRSFAASMRFQAQLAAGTRPLRRGRETDTGRDLVRLCSPHREQPALQVRGVRAHIEDTDVLGDSDIVHHPKFDRLDATRNASAQSLVNERQVEGRLARQL
ncbi:MAG: hypothetical protein H6724_11430 [Sandaracinus sp.]|nr:hypothetical protein [Sandaracinus sp.]